MSNAADIRVLVADDDNIVRHGLVSLISLLQGIVVIGEAANGRDTIEQCVRLEPDVVLLDLNMPLVNGVEVTRQLRNKVPNVRVLILSGMEDDALIAQIRSLGALGYLLKSTTIQELEQAIRSVAEGNEYFSPQIHERLTRLASHAKRTESPSLELTDREREVLRLVAQGLSHQQIAESLHISIRTVDTHRNNIIKKLNIHDAAGLVVYAISMGLLIVPKKTL